MSEGGRKPVRNNSIISRSLAQDRSRMQLAKGKVFVQKKIAVASLKSLLVQLNSVRTALLIYVVTVFVSAGLLFVVEPMIAKMALPQLGGTPNVWNICLFFFQSTLLLSYTYAHALVRRLSPKGQIGLHSAVLAAVSLTLPLKFVSEAMPSSELPAFWLLGRLAVTVGPPFFAIAATAPLLQRWFSQIGHKDSGDPYFLYAASNFGSLLTLIAYPLVIEPNLSLNEQSQLWSEGFVVLVLGLGLAAVAYWAPSTVSSVEVELSAPTRNRNRGRERLGWVALAFMPSSLLLGVTAHITTDIAATPLFWVVPLALYLLTFVLTFARQPPLSHTAMVRLLPIVLIPALLFVHPLVAMPALLMLPLNLACFFAIAMVCHGQLAQQRPETDRLTEFYFFLSLGGVLGGLFNAILAPMLFPDIWEFPLALVLACLLMPGSRKEPRFALAYDLLLPATPFVVLMVSRTMAISQWQPVYLRVAMFAVYLLVALVMMSFRQRRLRFTLGAAVCVLVPWLTSPFQILVTDRSFFGVYRVSTVDGGKARILMHGTTLHGAASLLPGEETMPTGYYSRAGPFGRFFAALESVDIREVGIIGLGTGGLSCYARPGEQWTFYEIDPLVERIAGDQRYFQFMNRCGNHPHVILGDARINLANARDGFYDVLVVDAFSSDSIPTHLLTKEALALYLRKLAPRGVLLFHISNRYLDLEPVIVALAYDSGGEARTLSSAPPETGTPPWRSMVATVAAVAPPGTDLNFLTGKAGWIVPPRPPANALWTDQRSNIVRAIRWFF